jgi:hypothetical protein
MTNAMTRRWLEIIRADARQIALEFADVMANFIAMNAKRTGLEFRKHMMVLVVEQCKF